MSNAKLKEQIEAAKIALVHSAEFETQAPINQVVNNIPNPKEEANKTSIVSSLENDLPRIDNTSTRSDVTRISSHSSEIIEQKVESISDLGSLQTRIEDLEEQIKNQQRDLHTLLQKLRVITAKSQATPKPHKAKSKSKWIFGFLIIGCSIVLANYILGAETVVGAAYDLAGWAIAIIDTLSNKF